MDPITLAITSAIAAGVLSSTSEVAKQAIVDLYTGLKTLLKKKYGEKSDLNDAIDRLEKRSESDARQKVVEEEVAAARADKDSEILNAAQVLLNQLKEQPHITQNVQTAIGSNIVQADRGSKATLNITHSKKDDHD